MKTFYYEKLLAEFKPSGYVGMDANIIANELIHELRVQSGDGLARFLNVDICFDNHMTMRVWVQKRLENQDGYFVDDMFNQLQSELYALLPQLGY